LTKLLKGIEFIKLKLDILSATRKKEYYSYEILSYLKLVFEQVFDGIYGLLTIFFQFLIS